MEQITLTTPTVTSGITASELYRLISQPATTNGEAATIEWPEGDITLDETNQTLIWELNDYGNLPVTLSRSENEWIAMAPIVAVDSVKNSTELNTVLLRQGIALPLASVGIVEIDGRDFYVAYGQLFGDSKLESICAELHATASAAMDVAELIQTHFV
ncbi:cytoplasmic protein [Vreelandella sulfidaeris]|uniref:Cytoplasmic protein n=1 Tax=Vreelandella sulfidaeris TaxID=115553 RepID=A0A365TPN1_9GAMM|nr:cytoplasmic protein [Halomonas sulfidaeris]